MARRQADQIYNLSLTRTATVTLASGRGSVIGIGRVKTPTLAIVCRRELEIRSFVPEPYHEIVATAAVAAGRFQMRYAPKERIRTREEANAIALAAEGFEGPLGVKVEEKRQAPPRLHDLPSLQKLCGSRFGWSATKTLEIAQELYDGAGKKVITYPRAETRYLPESLIGDAPRIVAALQVGQSFAAISVPQPPLIRRGAGGPFSDRGLAGASHHAVAHDLGRISGAELRQLHRDAQLIFQDPAGALDTRMRLGESLIAPLDQNAIGPRPGRRAAVLRAMSEVGLPDAFFDRFPRECSGGQLQRAVIARALLMRPKLLVCDEPTSALDASIRAKILNLLRQLRTDQPDLTLLMITHDLRVVRHVCDRVAVMYLGEIVELADVHTLFTKPAHPYTQALIASSLLEEHGLDCSMGRVWGEPPSPLNPPQGCRFHTRCHLADALCSRDHPPLTDTAPGQATRCWHWRSAQAEAAELHGSIVPALSA